MWLSLVLTLIDRLSPAPPSNGLEAILGAWQRPSDLNAGPVAWWRNFSGDVYPVPCHSHNDYWRRVPLFQALSVGCMGVEADLWLDQNATDIFVGHSKRALRPDRTLQSLYLEPLATILSHQNSPAEVTTVNASVGINGVFDARPDVSIVLLLDLKTNGTALWPVIQRQLAPLRKMGWLTFWDGGVQRLVSRPVTVVVTGNAPFDLVVANSTHRDIFYDAPLEDVQNERYSAQNSYYASTSWRRAIGYRGFGGLRKAQRATLQRQIRQASEKGLISRYWDTPGWPVSLRNDIWRLLVTNDVGILNVDELVEASRWDWTWCQIAGLVLCGW